MGVIVEQKGDFSKFNSYLEKLKDIANMSKLDKYGREGVRQLEMFTPVDTGKTATSWYYTIDRSKDEVTLNFHNSNINDGVPIALILQYGHGTRGGGYVVGADYINPALKPIFEKILNECWREVMMA